jgi:hypothetical protein
VYVFLGTWPSFIQFKGRFLVDYKVGVLVGLQGMGSSRITGEF